jgi:hypothetical protein
VPVARLVREAAPALLSIELTDHGSAAGVPNTNLIESLCCAPPARRLRLVAHAYRVGLAVGATPNQSSRCSSTHAA